MRNEKGIALITVIILSALLFALVQSYIFMFVHDKRLIKSSESSLMARSIAEAGLEEVLWEYNYNSVPFSSGWVIGANTYTKTSAAFTDASGTNIGSYTVQVDFTSVTNPLVTATGDLTGTGTGTSSVILARLEPRPVFGGGMIAK